MIFWGFRNHVWWDSYLADRAQAWTLESKTHRREMIWHCITSYQVNLMAASLDINLKDNELFHGNASKWPLFLDFSIHQDIFETATKVSKHVFSCVVSCMLQVSLNASVNIQSIYLDAEQITPHLICSALIYRYYWLVSRCLVMS